MELFALGLTGVYVVVYVFLCLLTLAASVATYVLHSIGLYKIAERRYDHSIFAWIPFARSWLLGKLADQYEEAVHNKKTRYGTLLLGFSIATASVYLIIFVVMFAGIFITLLLDKGENGLTWMLGLLVVVLFIYLFLTIAYMVFFYLALYRLYKSSDEQNAVTYIVLSIFVRITMPVFIFLCGKKDSPAMQDYLWRRRNFR